MGMKRCSDGTWQLRQGIQIKETFRYPSENEAVRVVDVLQSHFPGRFPTVTSAKKVVRRNLVILDGQPCKVDDLVQGGQKIQLLDRVAAGDQLEPEQALMKIQVVYEDDSIACVIKPPGIQTQGISNSAPTLSSCLKYALKPAKGEGLLHRPREAHRLDSVTGGLLLAAKTRKSLEIIACSFSDRNIKKRYRAIVHGQIQQKNGEINKVIDGKESVTEYSVVQVLTRKDDVQKKFSVLDLWPQTGRYHQIRRHLAYIGHPICGDPLYEENGERRGAKRQKVSATQQVTNNNSNTPEIEKEQQIVDRNYSQIDAHSEGKDEELYWSDESIDNELKESIKNRLNTKNKQKQTKIFDNKQNQLITAIEQSEQIKNSQNEEGKIKKDQNQAGKTEQFNNSGNGQKSEQSDTKNEKKEKKEAPKVTVLVKSDEIVEDAFLGEVMLWAAGLRFVHPMDGRQFQIDLEEPGYFQKFRNEFTKS
eukprot:TRINITY_DN28039_c1_g1_i5.p1 TRINITY_DN28039_c1_g1~~TRINITY_DN28039_c1_g1_i5.p1  ORF type:complete len:476 (-),score=67.04 TRINITY_DN28039_c1_g1_i5:153-1580(-)